MIYIYLLFIRLFINNKKRKPSLFTHTPIVYFRLENKFEGVFKILFILLASVICGRLGG